MLDVGCWMLDVGCWLVIMLIKQDLIPIRIFNTK